jgi:uncharacterized membrane protein YeaQ/YmgE (transglycosylase-associated protein family)
MAHKLAGVIGTILLIMFWGFMVGGFARLAVPGPDPMPAWLTIAIGLAGSILGGGIAWAIFGRSGYAIQTAGFVAAILLVIAYRRFFQGRPLTGPDALKFPDRGVGIQRFRERRAKTEQMLRQAQHAQAKSDSDYVQDQIHKLADLHDAGEITDEEFETKKRELLARL